MSYVVLGYPTHPYSPPTNDGWPILPQLIVFISLLLSQKLTKIMIREVIDHDRQARGLKKAGAALYRDNKKPQWWPLEVRRSGKSLNPHAESSTAPPPCLGCLGATPCLTHLAPC